MREIARELHVCFFGLQRTFLYDGLADRTHSARGQPNRRITKITRNVNAPLYDGLMTARTVIAVNQTVVSLFFNTRVYGEK